MEKEPVGLRAGRGRLRLRGDDDDEADKSVGPVDPAVRADAVEVMSVIVAADLDVGSLFTNPDGQTIEGVSGELVITAGSWKFNSYSPDGALVFDGELTVRFLSSPITMRGDLTISGSKEADVDVDMTIALVPDAEDPDDLDIDFGGTVTYNGVEFQVNDLLDASDPEEEATDGE